MKLAFMGSGEVARKLAVKFAHQGHEVKLGTRNVQTTLEREEPVGYASMSFKEWHKEFPNIGLDTFAEAAGWGELIINATGGMVSIAALESAGEENLSGKVLIDLANPLDFSQGMPPRLHPVNDDSLGEQIQRRFPDTKVVKALNTLNVNVMVAPEMLAGPSHLFICGDHDDAKETCKSLLRDLGWKNDDFIDMGGIISSRGSEMILPFWIQLMGALGTPEMNFYIQPKK